MIWRLRIRPWLWPVYFYWRIRLWWIARDTKRKWEFLKSHYRKHPEMFPCKEFEPCCDRDAHQLRFHVRHSKNTDLGFKARLFFTYEEMQYDRIAVIRQPE